MITGSLKENPLTKFEDVSSLVVRKCKAAQFAIRATTHSTLKFSPGELAFGRNILYPFPTQINWSELLNAKQEAIDKANIKENAKSRYVDNKIGDKILILNKATHKGKLEPTVLPGGPWNITQVHTNGTVSILKNSYVERMIIRRIRPFF